MNQTVQQSVDTPEEIAGAQWALDHYPDYSPYWDQAGRDQLGIIHDHKLTAKTTESFRRNWHRKAMQEAGYTSED